MSFGRRLLLSLALGLPGAGVLAAQEPQEPQPAPASRAELAVRQHQVDQLSRQVEQLEAAQRGASEQLDQRDRQIAELRQRLAAQQAAAAPNSPARAAAQSGH